MLDCSKSQAVYARLIPKVLLLCLSVQVPIAPSLPSSTPAARYLSPHTRDSERDGGGGSSGGEFLKRRSKAVEGGKVDWSHVKSRTNTR